MKFLFAICLLGWTLTAGAQNILTDPIQWNATGFTDVGHNTVVSNAPCLFKTSVTQIEWIQDQGNYVHNFSITGVSGSWSDVSKSGSIAFQVSAGALTGTATFQRNSDELTVQLVLNGGTDPINIRYSISTLEKL